MAYSMEKIYDEKIAVTVYGTDVKGEMFIEDTSTLTLARGWVKLTLRRKAPVGSEVIVFNKANGSQAEFLLQSQDGNVVTAELKDHAAQIWDRDFGGIPEPVPDTRERVHMICKACGTRESVPMGDKQKARAFAGEILWRHCAQCVDETDWQAEAVILAALSANAPIAVPAAAPAAAVPPPPPPPRPVELPAALRPSMPPPSFEIPEPEPPAAPPVDWNEKRTSRRIQMKTRARIRRTTDVTEVVAPLNVSKGGVCFDSGRAYALDEVIYVALHYREGGEAMETRGKIVRISPRGDVSEYGVRFDQ